MEENNTTINLGEQIQISGGEIDEEVLEILGKNIADKAILDDVTLKRFELNAICELLVVLNEISQDIKTMSDIISIASTDKLKGFFEELGRSVIKENPPENKDSESKDSK